MYSSDYLTEEIEFDVENDKISSKSNNDGKLIDNLIIYDFKKTIKTKWLYL